MKGDFHVRFRENVGVKFLRVTRLGLSKRGNCVIDTFVYLKYGSS
jgi:hypothetical protein